MMNRSRDFSFLCVFIFLQLFQLPYSVPTFYAPSVSSPIYHRLNSPYLYNSLPKEKVAVVSMTRKQDNLHTWVYHHIDRLGVSKIYLYFDYTPSLATSFHTQFNLFTPYYRSYISLVEMTPEWRRMRNYTADPTRDRSSENRARQILAVEHAVTLAIQDRMDWLFHIDTDELIHVRNGDTLSNYLSFLNRQDPARLTHTFVVYNFEMYVSHPNYHNCFTQGRWFLTQPAEFIAYANGKGFGRVTYGLRPYGVHRFESTYGNGVSQDISENELVILHYPCCNAESFVSKYRNLGNFNSEGWEWAWWHTEARDRMAECRESATLPLPAQPTACERRVVEEMFQKRVATVTTIVYIPTP